MTHYLGCCINIDLTPLFCCSHSKQFKIVGTNHNLKLYDPRRIAFGFNEENLHEPAFKIASETSKRERKRERRAIQNICSTAVYLSEATVFHLEFRFR